MNLKDMISRIDVSADWIGLREYKENTTYHMIRDKNPLSNGTNIDHGAVFTGYLGLFLAGSVYASMGIFASSLTDIEVVGFI